MNQARQPKTCCNPRDVVEAIDEMIALRLAIRDELEPEAQLEERIEVLKRMITDYLLVNNIQKGVYRDPEYEPPVIRPNS